MDAESRDKLVRLLQTQRSAALGTIREGVPLVSHVLFVPDRDLAAFYVHVSRLAWHTQDMLRDPRVGLMIAEPDRGDRNPQTLARISIGAEAHEMGRDDPAHQDVAARYLERFPEAAMTFGLGDFSFFQIRPIWARYVAGFARAFNLRPEDLRQLAPLMT